MKTELNNQVLGKIVAQLLEEATFVFSETTTEAEPWKENLLTAKLLFEGDFTGELTLTTNPSFATMLAANYLGTEPERIKITNKEQQILAELTNMIGGALVEKCLGNLGHCEKGIPEVEILSPKEFRNKFNKANCAVTLLSEEGKRIDATFFGVKP